MNEIANKLKSGIDRFLTEMGPFWKKEAIAKLIGDLETEEFKSAIKELEKDGIIIYVGHNDCFFIISEKYLKKSLPEEYLQEALQKIAELKKGIVNCRSKKSARILIYS